MARRRNIFRVLLPAVGVCLLGLLAWVIIAWFLRPPKLDLIAIAVADYRNPEVPPIAYCYEDLEGLHQALDAGESQQSSFWNEGTSQVAELGTRLRETSNAHDNVLVYIKAHGVSIDGEALLLGGNFRLNAPDDGRLRVDVLLKYVAESPAKIKLLVLDTGHIQSDPRMGMLANQFTHLLTQAVKNLRPQDNVWVLTSNSLFESSQVSLKDRRSAFGYYLAEGLSGRADGILEGADETKAPDRLVQLDELYKFVRDYVNQYARVTSDDNQSQTPMLLRSGEGEVTNPPHEVLLRIEKAPATEEPEVAVRAGARRKSARANIVHNATALALLGNQTPAGGAADVQSEAPASEAKKQAAPKEDAGAVKDAKPSGEPAAATEKPEDSKAQEKAASASAPPAATAATASAPAAKPEPRKRERLEQQLFDYESWLQNRQADAENWRPADFAPDLARLYCESLAGCRQRALAGYLFRNSPDYQVSLDRKLAELKKLQDSIAQRLKSFESGAARPTYERDSQVRSAIRYRNEACHLLPSLIAHHALLSTSTQPTMQRDLLGLIEATSRLDKQLAHSPISQHANTAQDFNAWKQTLAAEESAVRAHLDRLGSNFQLRCDDQRRALERGDNPTVSRRLEELACGPLATAERREELHAQARSAKAALGFAETEKHGTLPSQPPSSAQQPAIAARGWQLVLDRAELELALAALAIDGNANKELPAARQALAAAQDAADLNDRLAQVQKLDAFLFAVYRKTPERLREQLRSKNYSAWRAAETAIRLADARDQGRIEAILNDRTARIVANPIADVPLAALPEINRTYRIAVGGAGVASGNAMAINFGVPETLAVRFLSNAALPPRLRFQLKYDPQRLSVKDAQGAALGSERILELNPNNSGGGSTSEFRLDLNLESRDQLGAQTKLELFWLDANNNPLSRENVTLAHPEPVLSQLAVFGQRGAADHTWRTSQGESYFDVPFTDGIAHVTLMPFSGHETRYDFRLTNTAKHAKKYQVVIYSIPSGLEPGLTPKALAAAAERSRRAIARNELAIAAGETASLRFDSPPPVAPAAPPDAAKTAADKTADAKEPPPDVTAGFVCVLAEDSKLADGKDTGQARRQTIVVEAVTQLPQFYIAPTLNYVDGEISVVLNVPDVTRLPAAGAKVELQLNTDQQVSDSRARFVTDLTRNDAGVKALRAYVRTGTSSRAQVFLNVDDYRRAFVYELPLDANRSNVERKLDLHEISLPSDQEFPVYYPGMVGEPVAFPFKVDMPPLHDGSYGARVFIDDAPDGDSPERRRAPVWSQDRVHRVALLKAEEAPFLVLRSQTSDLVATLDLNPYRNQAVYVRVQLFRRLPNDEDVLAEKSVKIYLDGEPPMLSVERLSGAVVENTPFTVNIDARDKVTDIKQVEVALKTQANPDAKATEKVILVDPKPVPMVGGAYQLTHVFEKANVRPQSLYFQATDMRGNKSEIRELEVEVRPTPTVAVDKGVQVPVAKLGSVAGRAALPDGARGDIKAVILKDAGGKVLGQQSPAADGAFFFDKLPPGQYTIEAKGFIGGNESKPVPVNVTVEAGKRARSPDVLLGR